MKGYAETVAGVVGSISGDADVRAELSPGARAALDVTAYSLVEVAKGNGGKVTDALVDLALSAATDILKSVAKDVGLDALASGGGSIPFLGAIVGVVAAIAGGPHAAGVGYTVEDQKHFCSTPVQQGGWFRSVASIGTGPGGQLMPCDLLVQDSGFDKKGRFWVEPTELSWLIQLATETVGEVAPKGGHMPAKRRGQYAELRRSIQATHKRFGTDGGALLWILYVDMLRADADRGRLHPTTVRYLHILDGAAMYDANARFWLGDKHYGYYDDFRQGQDRRDVARDLLAHGEGAARKYAAELIPDGRAHMMCGLWTGAARKQMFDLIQVWRQTLTPYYVQFESLEAKARAAAQAHFHGVRLKIAVPNAKAKADAARAAAKARGVVVTERPKSHALPVAGAGLLGMALLFYFL